MLRSTMMGMIAVAPLGDRTQAKNADVAKLQRALIGVPQANTATDVRNVPATQWFSDVGLGPSLSGGISPVDGIHDLSWGMMANYPWGPKALTPQAYWKLPDRFAPQQYKPDSQQLAANVLDRLVKCRAWGGNVLANCGPHPTGNMPDSYSNSTKTRLPSGFPRAFARSLLIL